MAALNRQRHSAKSRSAPENFGTAAFKSTSLAACMASVTKAVATEGAAGAVAAVAISAAAADLEGSSQQQVPAKKPAAKAPA